MCKTRMNPSQVDNSKKINGFLVQYDQLDQKQNLVQTKKNKGFMDEI